MPDGNEVSTSSLLRWIPLLSGHSAPWLAGGAVFLSTLSCSIPSTPLVVGLAAVNRSRWWTVALGSATGSAMAAALMGFLLANYGFPLLSEQAPEIIASRWWHLTTTWLASYGLAALALITALPLPHTPALLLCGLAGMSPLQVLGAFFLGKSVKYGLTALLTARLTDGLQRPD